MSSWAIFGLLGPPGLFLASWVIFESFLASSGLVVHFRPPGALWGSLGPPRGPPGEATWKAHFGPFWTPQRGPKAPKIVQNLSKMSLLALLGPLFEHRNSSGSNIFQVENSVFLHLATIFDEKSAWDTVKYEVSTCAESTKPCILRIQI